MPIKYRFDTEAGIVFVNWHGTISMDELVRHYRALLKDEHFPGISRALTDLRESTLDFSGVEFWRTIDDHYREAVERKAFKVAILVANEEHRKYAGIWKTLVPNTVMAAVFEDSVAAFAWLQGDQDPEAQG